MSGSLYLGTIAGIRMSAHYSWLFILALFTASLATGWFPYTLPGPSSVTSWLTGCVAAFLLFASVLAHELAHSLVARARGVPIRSITLYFFGGLSNLEEEPRSPGVEFQITIVGPLTSLLIGVLAWLAHGLVLPSTPLGAGIFGYLAGINCLLVLFNLIPGFPLDGGRVLRSLLWKLTGSVQAATHWSAEVGQVVAFLFILAGIWFFVTGGLFSGLWLAVIGWFLLTAARNAGTRAIRETPFQNVSIDRAMRSVLRVVSPGLTVQNLMESYMLPRKLSVVPVMEGEQVVGLITLAAVEQVSREAWEQVVVGQIMTPRHQLQTVSPQQPLQEALALMDQHDDQHLLVMQDDHLAGIVSRDSIVRLRETLPAQGPSRRRNPAHQPTAQSELAGAERRDLMLHRALPQLLHLLNKHAIRVGIILFCLLGFLLALLPIGRASLRAAILLPAVVSAQAAAPLALLGEPIRHSQFTLRTSTGPAFLDVYAPTSPPPILPGARQAIVMVPGVGDNRERPQLVNLSEALAREGVVVVILTTPTLIAEQLVSTDTDALVQAFVFASHWPGVGTQRVGFVAFSAGSVLTCLAAADTGIREQVAFVAVLGGVFDLPTLLREVGQRATLVDGRLQPFQPDAVTIRVLAKTIARTLPAAEGHALVAAFAGGHTPSIPEHTLSPPGTAAYHLLAGDAPARVEANLAALSPTMKAQLRELSPSRVIDQIHAPVYLLHDRNDLYVPFAQARDFAAALARLGHPYELFEFNILRHAEITSGASPGALIVDGGKLYRVLRAVLLVGT